MSAERLAKSVPRTCLPQNEVQMNELARKLRKLRRPAQGSPDSSADIDQYNARQTMPARETRSKHRTGLTAAEQAAYAKGLTDPEWWAFQAFAMDVDTTHLLTLEVFEQASNIAVAYDWQYTPNPDHPQVMCLAKLVIDEWLHPAKYEYKKKLGTVECKSALARAMHMDRKTWDAHWRKRWLMLRPIPRDWYLHAIHTIDANYYGTLREFVAPPPRRDRRVAKGVNIKR